MKKFTTDRINGVIENGWARIDFHPEGWKYDIPTKVLFDYLNDEIHEDVVVQCGEYVAWDNGEPITRELLLKDTLKMYEEGEFSMFEALTTDFRSREDICKLLAGTKSAAVRVDYKVIHFDEEEYFTFRAFVIGAWQEGVKMRITYKK